MKRPRKSWSLLYIREEEKGDEEVLAVEKPEGKSGVK
jgi:hypothetical protein